MKIKTFLLSLLICTTSIIFAQTDPQKVNEPATMLMSEAPPQIEIFLLDGNNFRARKIAELSDLDFKSITSFIFYYPDENSENVKFDTLLDSLLNASPNLEVLKFSYGYMETLPEINNVNSNLKKLDLSHNKLKILPVGLNKFPNLEEVNLEDNDLKALPESLASLTNLKDLNFSLNSIHKELFMKSVLTLKFKGILHLSRLGLTEADYDKIWGKIKEIEVYQ